MSPTSVDPDAPALLRYKCEAGGSQTTAAHVGERALGVHAQQRSLLSDAKFYYDQQKKRAACLDRSDGAR